MSEYKPNSHKYKEDNEKKKIEKVVRGEVKTRKKSEIRKAADVFISEDIQNVKSYVVTDVLIPALKKTIYDVFTNGIDMILFGGTGRSNKGSSVSKVSYRSYYDSRDDRRDRSDSYRAKPGYSHDDIVLESRGEAEEVLTRMDELIETYGVVSVADLYDLLGKSCAYTDNKYGWTNLRNAEPVRVRDGYLLKLPKALPID